MNKHLEAMKKQITGYKALREAAEARIQQITEEYGKEAGEKERERQEKRLQSSRAAAQAAIKEAYSEGVRTAKEWGQLDGGRLTDDVKLLDSNLVSPADFDELKQKHSGNAMMMRALKQYGDRRNAAAAEEAQKKGGSPLDAFGHEPYNVRDIVTLADKLQGWETAQKQANDSLDMIDGTGRYTDRWTRAFSQAAGSSALEHFGEEERYSIL